MSKYEYKELKELNVQLSRLRQQACDWDNQGNCHAYQMLGRDDERFTSLSDRFVDYADELITELEQLKKLTNRTRDQELIQLFCNRLCGKYLMLQRCLTRLKKPQKTKTNIGHWQKQLKKISNSGNINELYAKLAQQREFEQRLAERINQQVEALQRSNDTEQSARLQQQILELKQRYGRCQKATWQIEQQILKKQSRFQE